MSAINIILSYLMKYMNISTSEAWRIGIGEELLNIRDNDEQLIPCFDNDELQCLLCYICVTWFFSIISFVCLFVYV